VSASIAGEIVLIFSVMFTIISVGAFGLLTLLLSKSIKKSCKKKRMYIIDKHFKSMIRIECPYCKTIYKANRDECPNCKANTKKILFPEIPADFD
jgi:hypothetical protein